MNNIKSLYDLYSEVERISYSLPNVNTFTESFDNLNREDVEYSAVVFQFRDGTQPSEGFVTYRFYLGYVDRVNEVSGSPSSNETLIQSVAEQSLRTIINKVNEEVEFKYGTLTPFEQRFTALTYGCYIDCSVTLAVSDCNYESGSVLRELVIDAKANGESEYVPGPGVDGWKKVRLDVDVNSLTDFDGMKYRGSTIELFPDGLSFAPRTGNNCVDMFRSCTSLKTVKLFDTSKARNFGYMFTGDIQLTDVPAFDTSNVTNFPYVFESCYALKAVPLFNLSKVTDITSMCYNCKAITELPQFDLSNVRNAANFAARCISLVSIPVLNLSSVTTTVGFSGCSKLTNLGGFTGMKNNIYLGDSPLLTHDSLLNVINEAADVTGARPGSKLITFGATNLAKLTDEEKAIATSKGWTLK